MAKKASLPKEMKKVVLGNIGKSLLKRHKKKWEKYLKREKKILSDAEFFIGNLDFFSDEFLLQHT